MINDAEDLDDLKMLEEVKHLTSHVEKKQNSQIIASNVFNKDEKLVEIYRYVSFMFCDKINSPFKIAKM